MPKECRKLQNELFNNPTLLELCQKLHQFNTGSSDSLIYDKELRNKIVLILETAIKYWEPTHKVWKDYDDAVLNIIKITLKEYYKCL